MMITENTFQKSIAVLKDLIQINSTNSTLVRGGVGEKEIARYLNELFQREGIQSEVQNIGTDRFNLVARVSGKKSGPRILLNGHLDTVGVGGMITPFEAREVEGKIYGRGSQDMKGGLAAAVVSLLALSQNHAQFVGEVVLAAVADEEDRSLGTEYFLRHKSKEEPIDFCIVLEPTDLKVCTAHKGFAWLEVTVHGKAAHGSRPNEGIDAIRHMGRVLDELDHLNSRLSSKLLHPLLGSGSLHNSLIEGGREWSSYPDRCVLKYERRTVPPENEETVRREIDGILRNLIMAVSDFQAESQLIFARNPFQQDRKHPLVSQFHRQAIHHFSELADWGTVSFWTDAALISEAGIPSVVFGPRGAGLHSLDEYVIASDVVACAKLLYDFILALSRN
jgi:acetylornithine deacetylase